MLTVPERVLDDFEAFTGYNSPYAAHEDGRAIDLYPGTVAAPSPVAGTVTAVHRVRAPRRPYARAFDYVIGIDTGRRGTGLRPDGTGEPAVARILHVDPAVDPGDVVAAGDHLGTLIRAGFFAPWVDRHLHVGFRPRGAELRRASGSLPLRLTAEVTPLSWDGTGTVATVGRTYVELEADLRPRQASAPWVGLATDDGGVIDGGLPHYAHGGLLTQLRDEPAPSGPVSVLGRRVGMTRGRSVAWDPVTVRVDGEAITGLSLAFARPGRFRPKLIWRDPPVEVGTDVTVTIDSAEG